MLVFTRYLSWQFRNPFNFHLICKNSFAVNKKWLPWLIIGILALILFFVRKYSSEEHFNAKADRVRTTEVNRNRGFDRRVSYLEYTTHAKCRMKCRNIRQAEVEEIMKGGKINYSKSDVKDKPCPTYALEGITSDNQRVRIVFAQCDLKTKVVTSIDLDTEWECHCPGDNKNPSNKNKD
jgi:hypothetical protein